MRKSQKARKVYPVIIEQDEDGTFIGTVPTLPSCYTQGDSKEEVLKLLKEEVIPLCEDYLRSKQEEENSFIEIQELELEYA